jgi:hypothetical protein
LLQNALSWFVSSLDFLLLYYHYYLMNLWNMEATSWRLIIRLFLFKAENL